MGELEIPDREEFTLTAVQTEVELDNATVQYDAYVNDNGDTRFQRGVWRDDGYESESDGLTGKDLPDGVREEFKALFGQE